MNQRSVVNTTKSKGNSVNVFKVAIFAILLVVGMNFSLQATGNGGFALITKAETAKEAYDNVTGNSGGTISGVKSKVTSISADAQSIVLTIVMGFLICTTLWTATKFSGAGDNPQKKAILKSALIFQILGIVFVSSYSGGIVFGLQNLNIFATSAAFEVA